jgi:hypothetical protein
MLGQVFNSIVETVDPTTGKTELITEVLEAAKGKRPVTPNLSLMLFSYQDS